jgi:WD40 repeat protein
MVSGSADNTLRLWSVSTGKNLYTWEFPTAVKRVEFSDDDEQIVCITEQRMGHQCAIRVFNINREGDDSNRECHIFRLHRTLNNLRPRRIQGSDLLFQPDRFKSNRLRVLIHSRDHRDRS